MKNLKNIIVAILLIAVSNSYSQSPIIDLNGDSLSLPTGGYVKDINNVLDPFQGTWLLDDGVNYLKIVLVKKHTAFLGRTYEDMLIGEFQYKKNGVELLNSLSNINSNIHVYSHKISGNSYYTNHTPFDDYTTDNFRIHVSFSEPNNTYEVDIRLTTVNGQPAIQIFKRMFGNPVKKGSTIYNNIVPNGFMYLLKI